MTGDIRIMEDPCGIQGGEEIDEWRGLDVTCLCEKLKDADKALKPYVSRAGLPDAAGQAAVNLPRSVTCISEHDTGKHGRAPELGRGDAR